MITQKSRGVIARLRRGSVYFRKFFAFAEILRNVFEIIHFLWHKRI
jgi:hypothetical protein